MQQTKDALRTKYKALRASLPPDERAAAEALICNSIARHKAFLHCEVLYTFSPVRGEIDLTPLALLAKSLGKQVAFPRCEGNELHFYLCDPSELVPGRFGIPTPPYTAQPAPNTPASLCLLPALAAGEDGGRLGYGGGFYDRFLPHFQGVTLLPIYHTLTQPTLPQEPTDVKPQYILTEKGVLYYG